MTSVSEIHTPARQQVSVTYSSLLRQLAAYVGIRTPTELAVRVGKRFSGLSTVKSHWRLSTAEKQGKSLKGWRNREPRLPSLPDHQQYCRVLDEDYRRIRNERGTPATAAQKRTLHDRAQEAVVEQQSSFDKFTRGDTTDSEFFAAFTQLENAWTDAANAKAPDTSGLPCKVDNTVLEFCQVHSSPFERRSETCALATLKRSTAFATAKEPETQFISSLKDCSFKGTAVTWPELVWHLKSLGLDDGDNREKELNDRLNVLIDFSGFRGEYGGFLLSLRRPGPSGDRSGESDFRRSSTKGGGLEGRTRNEKYGTSPSLGVGNHLVIRHKKKVRLAVRLQRAPNANEIWMLYPESFVWRSTTEQAKAANYPWDVSRDRVVVMPTNCQTDDVSTKLQQEEFERIRSRDPSLQILFEERVNRNDSGVKILFVAQPDIAEFKRLEHLAKKSREETRIVGN